jgi:hypothetical protein
MKECESVIWGQYLKIGSNEPWQVASSNVARVPYVGLELYNVLRWIKCYLYMCDIALNNI